MKKASDPRHQHRQKIVKGLFAHSFQPDSDPNQELQPILSDLNQIDQLVAKNAPEWPISQINRVDLSVLRLAVYELTHTDTPQKVIIDEAVELGKEFGSLSSAKFINGVLGNVLTQLKDN